MQWPWSKKPELTTATVELIARREVERQIAAAFTPSKVPAWLSQQNPYASPNGQTVVRALIEQIVRAEVGRILEKTTESMLTVFKAEADRRIHRYVRTCDRCSRVFLVPRHDPADPTDAQPSSTRHCEACRL